MDAPKRCPNCGHDSIRSVDSYLGTCDHRNGEPQGWTDINWDTCEPVGYECRVCDWEHMFGPGTGEHMDRLATAALAIHTELDGVDWSPDTLDAIAEHIMAVGLAIRGPDEMPPPLPIWQVRIEHADRGVEIHHFATEAEASQFADDIFVSMDTADAIETSVGVKRYDGT